MKTAAQINADMLARVRSDVDKREGSLIYTALAPAAAMLEEAYFHIDNVADTMMPDTARGSDQDRVNQQQGVIRIPASAAVRRGEFADNEEAPAAVPIGSRFSGGGVVYEVTELIEPGAYRLTCEEAGAIGNNYFGELLPLEYHANLASAILADVLIPGEDAEDDETYRARYYATVRSRPFAGNRAAYESEILQMPGVGGVHAYRRPESGSFITCVICSATMGVASPELVATVQERIDPVANSGEGLGLAPIGHRVTITSVAARTINVTAQVAPVSGASVAEAQAQAETAIAEYLQSISFAETVVRIARIESLLLNLDAIIDVANTKINGVAANLSLSATYANFEVPELGTVTLTEL